MSEDNDTHGEAADDPSSNKACIPVRCALTRYQNLGQIICTLTELLLETPKKQYTCSLCTEGVTCHSLEELYVLYAKMLTCLTYHCKTSNVFPVEELFLLDKFVFDCIKTREPTDVESVINSLSSKMKKMEIKDLEKMQCINLQENAYELAGSSKFLAGISIDNILSNNFDLCEETKKRLIGIYNMHFTDTLIKINCEQDIESMLYKWHKNTAKDIPEVSMELLLYTLYIRSEFVRFFRIYDGCKASFFTHRLATLATLDERCHRKRQTAVYDAAKAEKTTHLGHVGHILCTCDLLNFIMRDLGDLDKPLDLWIQNQRNILKWKSSVDVWAKSRNDDTGAVDNAMLELCDKKQRFDDGWMIYKSCQNQNPSTLHKICILCINAIKQTQNNVWVARLVEIVEYVIYQHESTLSCILTNDILTKLGNLPENLRMLVLHKFFRMIHRVDDESEVVNTLLRGFAKLCNDCQDTETCEVCAEYANEVYDKWKICRTGFFFNKVERFDSEIYENMLDICTLTKDCAGFRKVFMDRYRNADELDKNICRRLESFHASVCKTCTCKVQVQRRSDGMALLSHLLNK